MPSTTISIPKMIELQLVYLHRQIPCLPKHTLFTFYKKLVCATYSIRRVGPSPFSPKDTLEGCIENSLQYIAINIGKLYSHEYLYIYDILDFAVTRAALICFNYCKAGLMDYNQFDKFPPKYAIDGGLLTPPASLQKQQQHQPLSLDPLPSPAAASLGFRTPLINSPVSDGGSCTPTTPTTLVLPGARTQSPFPAFMEVPTMATPPMSFQNMGYIRSAPGSAHGSPVLYPVPATIYGLKVPKVPSPIFLSVNNSQTSLGEPVDTIENYESKETNKANGGELLQDEADDREALHFEDDKENGIISYDEYFDSKAAKKFARESKSKGVKMEMKTVFGKRGTYNKKKAHKRSHRSARDELSRLRNLEEAKQF